MKDFCNYCVHGDLGVALEKQCVRLGLSCDDGGDQRRVQTLDLKMQEKNKGEYLRIYI